MNEIGYIGIKSKTFYTGSKIFMGKNAALFIIYSKK